MDLEEILRNSENSTLKKLRAEEIQKEKQAFKQRKDETIKAHAETLLETLRSKMRVISKGGNNTLTLNSNTRINYDGILISEAEFIEEFKKLINQENTDPNIEVRFNKNTITWNRINDYPETQKSFYTQLSNDVDTFNSQRKIEKENYEMKQLEIAKLTYEDVKKKMQEAALRGENYISYNSESKDPYIPYWYFDYHKKMFNEENPNIIVWKKRTSSIFNFGTLTYNLYWRRKYWWEYFIWG